jgi:hypothetical protein
MLDNKPEFRLRSVWYFGIYFLPVAFLVELPEYCTVQYCSLYTVLSRTLVQKDWKSIGTIRYVFGIPYYLRSIPLVHFDFLVEEILAFHQNVIRFL